MPSKNRKVKSKVKITENVHLVNKRSNAASGGHRMLLTNAPFFRVKIKAK